MKPEEFDNQFLEWLDKAVGRLLVTFAECRRVCARLMGASKAGKHDEVSRKARRFALSPYYSKRASFTIRWLNPTNHGDNARGK